MNESELVSSEKAEGCLVKRLHSALKLVCEKFVSSIKFTSFKKTYRAIYNINPEAFKSVYDQWTSQIHSSILEDLDEFCAEYSIDFLLTSLEKIKDNQCSQISWRPSGNPDEDLRDHIYPLKVKHKENLKNVLSKLIVANEELASAAAINHAEILHIKSVNEDLHGKFSEIVTSLTGPNLEKLITDTENILEKV